MAFVLRVVPRMWASRTIRTNPALRTAFADESRALCARGLRIICLLVVATSPVFALVDWARFPQWFGAFVVMRTVYALSHVAILISLHWRPARRHAHALALLSVVLGVVQTLCMMHGTGGHASPYYAGIGLAILAMALIMPWSAWWSVLASVIGIGGYLIYAWAFPAVGAGTMFLNNLFSFVATGMIAAVTSASREHLRQREFVTRWELQETFDQKCAKEQALEEEAQVSAALARVAREMMSLLDTPLALARLSELTTELLHCDVSQTFLCESPHNTWSAVSGHGDTPEQREAVQHLKIPGEIAGRWLGEFHQHDVVQLVVPASSGLVPTDVPLDQGFTRAMCLALRSGERIIAIHTAAYRERREAFTPLQERIARGIAQIGSLALANARLVEELDRANRLKSEFVSTISHELRTPLNVMLGYAEMARDEELDPGARRQLLDGIERSNRQLLGLIEDTLEVGKLEAGRRELRLEPITLPALWTELRQACSALPRKHGVSLQWAESLPDVVLTTDRHKLLIIVRNLVGNALKFTERGWVRADVQVRDDVLTLRVIDTGIGIRAEDHAAIFELFRQADGSDSRVYDGTGLGLYIVRRFAEQLGGSISVESAPGRGSTFSVCLPRQSVPAPASEPRGKSSVRRPAAA